MFDYVIERKLPNGVWQKVTGTMTVKTIEEVKKILAQQNANTAFRILSITKK